VPQSEIIASSNLLPQIADLDDFDLAVRRVQAGAIVEVTVTRATKPVKLKVTLDVPC
jgi:hypothetical protein